MRTDQKICHFIEEEDGLQEGNFYKFKGNSQPTAETEELELYSSNGGPVYWKVNHLYRIPAR